jgi:hypothetical protein
MEWDEGTHHVLSGAAESVDGLGDVAVHAADEHVVLFGVDGGEEGQEGGEEEEAHCVVLCCVSWGWWCGVVVLLFCFVVKLCVNDQGDVGQEE